MNNNKKIIYVVAGLLILIIIGFVIKKEALSPTAENLNDQSFVATSTPENIVLKESPSVENTDSKTSSNVSNPIKDEAWNLFQKYLSYNNDKNLDGVKSVVYKISNVCNTDKPSNDCINRMSMAYFYGMQMKKDLFVNVWSDNRQVIMSTDFDTDTEATTTTRYHSAIFFVRGSDGALKLLSFSPILGSTLNTGSYSVDEIKQRLISLTEDGDKDGIADYQEQCKDAQEGRGCVKTDPTKRDTDGDGLWDGINFLINSLNK